MSEEGRGTNTDTHTHTHTHTYLLLHLLVFGSEDGLGIVRRPVRVHDCVELSDAAPVQRVHLRERERLVKV